MARQKIQQDGSNFEKEDGLRNIVDRARTQSTEVPADRLPTTSHEVKQVIEHDDEGKRLIDWTGLINEPAKRRTDIDQ